MITQESPPSSMLNSSSKHQNNNLGNSQMLTGWWPDKTTPNSQSDVPSSITSSSGVKRPTAKSHALPIRHAGVILHLLFLNRTLAFDWCVVRWGPKDKQPRAPNAQMLWPMGGLHVVVPVQIRTLKAAKAQPTVIFICYSVRFWDTLGKGLICFMSMDVLPLFCWEFYHIIR